MSIHSTEVAMHIRGTLIPPMSSLITSCAKLCCALINHVTKLVAPKAYSWLSSIKNHSTVIPNPDPSRDVGNRAVLSLPKPHTVLQTPTPNTMVILNKPDRAEDVGIATQPHFNIMIVNGFIVEIYRHVSFQGFR